MGFNPIFYAGRPKLSEVTIDSDLDMGGRNILRVGRVDSPYMPETWPTETLEWGDIPEGEPVRLPSAMTLSYTGQPKVNVMQWTTPPEASYRWEFQIRLSGSPYNIWSRLYAGDTLVDERNITGSSDFVNFSANLPQNTATRLELQNVGSHNATVWNTDTYRKNTGTVVGPKTFNLSGKWLALGLDMKGLAATVKIQGVEIPYSDYAKYFPLAPTELKFPGDWSPSQVRPIVKVYV